ncbi:hypothetical protein ACT80S_14880 [Ramlibacter sp. MAHUQ-53]|uniref:type III secretion apparatus assembly protein SctX n=1 Tax=unclassified Ramlibacter TaxID=2617605 RepID=UPI00363ABF10
MSDFRIGSGPFFERGIDQITFRRNEGAQGLPDRHHLIPADQASRPQLERLLARPTLDSLVEDAITPDIEDPELLLPARFRGVLKNTLATLRRRSEKEKDPRSRNARALARAAGLLAEEDELRDLAQMYLSTLYQG